MKIYLINLKKCDYDEYDAFVVIAEDENKAWEFIKREYPYTNINDDNLKSVDEIGITDSIIERTVLGSFNAG